MLLVYSEIITPRIKFIVELIFTDFLGLEYEFISDKNIFKNHNDVKINYSKDRIADEFFINSNSLLFENKIEEKQIRVVEEGGMKILFPIQNSDIAFDIFASTFYMVSRYEEYLPFTPDIYGRFPATESLAYKNNFLQLPIVDIWIEKFKTLLLYKYPSLQFKNKYFKTIFTYDIDVAYAYKGRSLLRYLKSIMKDVLKLNFKNIYTRISVVGNFNKDPWDVYGELREMIFQKNLKTIFFFLLGDNSKNDKNLHYKSDAMKAVVTTVSSFSDIGIHPSFLSSQINKKINIEKKRLEEITNEPINKSRQHFLKFKLPDTFNTLIDAGINEDYSMGFADGPGFRAGTCTPFYFYDLKNEKATQLKIFSVTCMEVSYIKYLKVDAENALQNIFTLIKEVKKVNGLFISIWHNDNLTNEGDGKLWKNVHDKMVDYAVSYLNN